MTAGHLFEDIKNAIYDDGYIWIVVHGPPRSSKSTLALWASYFIYQDWDKVLESIVFNLPTLMQRIESGQPCRWPTVNKLHMRVPVIIYDDFGVHSNKADTQHSSAWDIFKGGFDCIGTELAVLLATMVNAEEATSQLQNKYNAEVTVKTKGTYKYDKVEWLQDFRGFRTRMKKTWIENGTFDPIPMDVYMKYDKMRMELTKEVFVRIKDALSTDNLEMQLRLLKPDDERLLLYIDQKGPTNYDTFSDIFGEKTKDTVTRCKARNLIIATQSEPGRHPKYELTQLGKDLLDKKQSQE